MEQNDLNTITNTTHNPLKFAACSPPPSYKTYANDCNAIRSELEINPSLNIPCVPPIQEINSMCEHFAYFNFPGCTNEVDTFASTKNVNCNLPSVILLTFAL